MTLAGRKGRAALCFPRAEGDGDGDGSAWFQGYFVCSRSRVQLGLLGEQQPVDDCVRCSHGGYEEYKLTVLHYELDKEASFVVRKTGGDLCQLESDELCFTPELLLTDAKAMDAVKTYFPTIAARAANNPGVLADCVVVFGDMVITRVDFGE